MCEPLNGAPLNHKTWRRDRGLGEFLDLDLYDDGWLCECADGHVYLIPEEKK
jgi:hypothetical protein